MTGDSSVQVRRATAHDREFILSLAPSGLGAVLFPAAEAVGNTGDIVGLDLADEMARATNAEAARRGLSAMPDCRSSAQTRRI